MTDDKVEGILHAIAAIIIAIIVYSIMATVSLIKARDRNAKLEGLCSTYEQVLDVVYRDQPDYYLDVLTEDDVYYELQEKKESLKAQ